MDPLTPDTRTSLLLRVRDASNHEAWVEFAALYSPVIYRAARRCGLQDADAQDLTQQVLFSTASALQARPHDPDRAMFRTWLYTVTRNAAIKAIQRGLRERGIGGASQNDLLAMTPATDPDEELWEWEYQRERFLQAARCIEADFAPVTWSAFWMTMVDGLSMEEVAQKLGCHRGSIYAARSRVMKRLREELERQEPQ
ncbi:MAG: RNA polymerase sigma factor [Pirellulales bacterium]